MWTSPMFDMMESAKADANQNKGDVHMSLGNVIRKYRKIKNLTQEEMAGRLGVTAPAVNKWENENSYPDITLLAPIARLLGISLDTLLSFREELTAEEITGMIREADQKLKNEPYEEVLQWAKKKLEEYPNCEELILNFAVIFDAQRLVREIPKKAEYDDYFCSLYTRVLNSADETIRIRAADALVGFYMRKKQYDMAEKYLEYFSIQNPERKGNRHRFMLKRIGWRKHIKHMRNFYFQIFKEPVWSCMECICLQYRMMTKKERICW